MPEYPLADVTPMLYSKVEDSVSCDMHENIFSLGPRVGPRVVGSASEIFDWLKIKLCINKRREDVNKFSRKFGPTIVGSTMRKSDWLKKIPKVGKCRLCVFVVLCEYQVPSQMDLTTELVTGGEEKLEFKCDCFHVKDSYPTLL